MNSGKISILFANEADELLEKGDLSAALNLCKSGIEIYRDYPMGYLVAAFAFYELEDRQSALHYVEKGLFKFPNYIPLLKLRNIIEDSEMIKLVASELEEEENYGFDLDDKTEETENEDELIEEKKFGEAANKVNEQANFLRLVKTADKKEEANNPLRADNPVLIPGLGFTPLRATRHHQESDYVNQDVRFPEFYKPGNDLIDEDEPDGEDKVFATDTMAQIMETQKAYEEAIKIYSILIETNPVKKDFYIRKIEEMTRKLNG